MNNFEDLSVSEESLRETAKPLFYGYIFLTGIASTFSLMYAGTMLGLSMMAAITFVSAGLFEALDEDWERFMQIVAIITLLFSVLGGAYIAAVLSVT